MKSLSPFHKQRGAALITGLIFLVVLTMIGITAARMSTLEERMAGNMRDRSLAMQAAEMALRDAERDILGLGVSADPRNSPISGISDFVADCGKSTGTDKDDGLCYYGAAAPPIPLATCPNPDDNEECLTNDASAEEISMKASPSVEYGRFTGADDDLGGLSALPRYLIEAYPTTPGGEQYYRITVRAHGANENTVVWLQEVFKP